jgi:hypothetical protein
MRRVQGIEQQSRGGLNQEPSCSWPRFSQMNEPFEQTLCLFTAWVGDRETRMLAFSPSGEGANAEDDSQHRDWYGEHHKKVSVAGATKRCADLLGIPTG